MLRDERSSVQHKATAQGVCNTMWGFARMGYSPLEGEFFRAVQLRALELMGEIRAQDVSNLWMAHGLLKVRHVTSVLAPRLWAFTGIHPPGLCRSPCRRSC